MNIKIILSSLLLISFLISCNFDSKFERVEDASVDPDRLAFATNISKNILTAQKNGSYYPLKEVEATTKMVEALDEQLQKSSYERIKSAFGDFQDLNFDHMEIPKDGSLYEMYRFKGNFNPNADVEVRVVLDANGKLAGFFVTPWRDGI